MDDFVGNAGHAANRHQRDFCLLRCGNQGQVDAGDNWFETAAAAGMSAAQWHVLKVHFLSNAIAAGIALITVVGWIGSSDKRRRQLQWPALALLVIAAGFMILGADRGGQAVYVQKLAVENRDQVIEKSQVPFSQLNDKQKIAKYLSPYQLHLVMAGLTLALAAAALALSLRAAARAHEITAADPINPDPLVGRRLKPWLKRQQKNHCRLKAMAARVIS